MTAKTPVRVRAGDVVDQAEQPESDTGQHDEQPRRIAGRVPNSERTEEGPAGLDEDDGNHGQHARRGRYRPSDVVRALECRGSQQVMTRADQQPDGEQADGDTE